MVAESLGTVNVARNVNETSVEGPTDKRNLSTHNRLHKIVEHDQFSKGVSAVGRGVREVHFAIWVVRMLAAHLGRDLSDVSKWRTLARMP